MKIYCLYDTIAEEAGPLFEAKNDNMARRIYQGFSEFPVGAKKEDFALLKLGYFDRGNEKEKPHVMGLTKSVDITKCYSIGEFYEPDEKNEKEYENGTI